MAVNLGFSVGPAIGGVLATIDYVWLFVADGITTGLGAAILFFHFGFRKYAKDKSAAERQRKAESVHDNESPLKDTRFVIFLLLMLAVAVVFFQFHATYPKYLEDHYQLSKPMIGLFFSVNTIIIVASEMLLLNWARKFSLLRTVGWGGLLACIGFGILPFGDSIWFGLFSMGIITIGEMFMFPIGTGFVAKRSIGRNQGMYMSWYAMMFSLAGTVAPIVGTACYSWQPNLLWYSSLAIGLASFAGFYFLAARSDSGSQQC